MNGFSNAVRRRFADVLCKIRFKFSEHFAILPRKSNSKNEFAPKNMSSDAAQKGLDGLFVIFGTKMSQITGF